MLWKVLSTWQRNFYLIQGSVGEPAIGGHESNRIEVDFMKNVLDTCVAIW